MHARTGLAPLLAALIAAVTACNPDDSPTAVTPPPPPATTTGLRDVMHSSLPSPYYHFEYDSTGRVTFVSFASDFTRYDVSYAGGRISEMRNNILVNHDRL